MSLLNSFMRVAENNQGRNSMESLYSISFHVTNLWPHTHTHTAVTACASYVHQQQALSVREHYSSCLIPVLYFLSAQNKTTACYSNVNVIPWHIWSNTNAAELKVNQPCVMSRPRPSLWIAQLFSKAKQMPSEQRCEKDTSYHNDKNNREPFIWTQSNV